MENIEESNLIEAKVEAVLFLFTKPVALKKIAKVLEVTEREVREAVERLQARKNVGQSGIHVMFSDEGVQLVTNPDFAELLQSFTKDDVESELTRPQLETLTIIAYRGPITKAEIEHIRGVNCTIILRNLLTRGLVIEQEGELGLQQLYSISADMLRYLGVANVSELPEYERFHKNVKIDQMLASLFNEEEK